MPDFRWSPPTGRFRDARGRFLSSERVRRIIDATLQSHTRAVQELTEQFRNRAVSLAEWERRMRQEIKNIHIYSALAAKGGKAQLTPQDYGRLGAVVKRQYRFLERLSNELSTGKQAPDGSLVNRARLYAQAGRGTMEATRQREMTTRGFDEERNVLGSAEHCDGPDSCLEQTARGWVPVGSLIPIGGRLCVTNCKCQIEYRNGATQDVAP